MSDATHSPASADRAQSRPGRQRRSRRSRGLRVLGGVLAALAILALVVAVVLQPAVRWATRRALDRVPGYRGEFQDASLSLLPLRYRITHLRLEPRDRSRPSLYADDLKASLDWKWLLHGHLRAEASVWRAALTLREAKGKAATEHLPDLTETLKGVVPGQLHRVQVKDSQLTYVLRNEKDEDKKETQAEQGKSTVPKLWVHGIEATIENLASRPQYVEGATTFAMTGTVNNSGKLSLFATADPLAKGLTFAGQMALQGMDLVDAYNLLDSKTDLAPKKGTLDVLARFGCKAGRLTGAVQPVVKNAELEAPDGNFFDEVKAWAANLGVKLASDRVPGRNAVATVVPIEGDLNDPKLQIWPAIFGVFRNAFVQGIGESFAHLPTKTAKEPQGLLEQAGSAVSEKAGLPKRQPQGRK